MVHTVTVYLVAKNVSNLEVLVLLNVMFSKVRPRLPITVYPWFNAIISLNFILQIAIWKNTGPKKGNFCDINKHYCIQTFKECLS